MSSDTITFVTVCYEGSNRHQSAELVSSIARAQIHTLSTKRNLATHVLAGTRLAVESADLLRIERRSKKHKGYVPLEAPADFKEFLRSLKVKNTMKLVVRTQEGVTLQPAPSASPAAPVVSSAATSATTSAPPVVSSPPASVTQLSPGAEAVESFRKLVTEFQHSEIYDCMKSFAGLYKQLMAPDGTPLADSESDGTPAKEAEECRSKGSDTLSPDGGRFVGMVHKGVVCDQCCPDNTGSHEYVTGVRYKCMVCHDFDLCASCYNQHSDLGKHKANHAMLGIEDSEWYKHFIRVCNSPWAAHYEIPTSLSFSNRSPVSSRAAREDPEAARKKEDAQRKLQDQAEKYQKLEALLDGEQESKFERLWKLIDTAQACEAIMGDVIPGSEVEEKNAEEMHSAEEDTNEMVVDSGEPLLVEVAVVPKGKSLSQILIVNKSKQPIQCKDLNLNIVNCFDMTVASILLEKKNGFVPNRTSKFNVSVSNTHFKYPFKIVLTSAKYTGSCQLSLKNMSGQVALVSMSTSATAEDPVESNTGAFSEGSQIEKDLRQMSVSSTPSFATASVHSIVLPSLPREVQSSVSIASEQTVAADADVTMSDDAEDDDDNEDYDLISVTEAEDLDSDFEILAEESSA